MESVIEVMHDVFDTYGQENPDKINKVYSYFTRDNILNLVKWIGDIQDFNSKDAEEFLKQKYMKEAQEKINDSEELYKKHISYNDEMYKKHLSDNEEAFRRCQEMCEKAESKQLNNMFEKLSNMINIPRKSNMCIGQEGEDIVEDALLMNDKYEDVNVKNVTQYRGCGDLIVSSEKYNLNIMVEVKNHKQHVTVEHVNTFIAHYSNYFQDNPDSHAIMFSINCKSISGKGSYKRETIIVNNRKHHILYISSVDMTKEFITEHFNIFTQQIIEENSISIEKSESNEIIQDISSIKTNTDYLYDIIDSFNYSKQRVYSEVRFYDEKIKNTEKHIQNNIDFMEERNYVYRKDVINIVYDVLNKMKNDGIVMDSCNSFKQSFKKIYSSISNFSNNSPHYVTKFVNTYKSYDSMYNILSSINI